MKYRKLLLCQVGPSLSFCLLIKDKKRPQWLNYILAGVEILFSILCDLFRLTIAVVIFSFLFSFISSAEASVPARANKYKSLLIRSARVEFGLNAPVSLLAAQIHQESAWREGAKSHAGAQGLAQFMPATAKWLPEVAPHVGVADPYNPSWAIRGMCAYNKWILLKIKNTHCDFDLWSFVLSAYNGGLGWVNRDRRLAGQLGYDPYRYTNHVDQVNAGRSAANIRENRGYPVRIFNIQHRYIRAGWGPGVPDCQ